MRSVRTSVCLLLLALLLPGAVPQDDLVKKVVPDADRIKKLTKRVSPESRAKIEKALGEKLTDADLSPPLWECYSSVPSVSAMERTRVLVLPAIAKGPKGPVRLGVAAATLEHTLHAVRLLENGDEKALEGKSFLSQFQGFEYTANVWNAPEQLAGAVKKAAEGKDPAAKELDTLLRMNALMRGFGPSWERLLEKIEKKDKSGADEVAAMDKAADETLKLVGNAVFLSASQQDKFRQYTTGAKADFADLTKLLKAGSFDDAQRRTGEIDSARCARCHGAYRRRFREARLAQNLGNGYFSTRLEISLPDPKLEASFQAVATAVRKAILVASEAK